MIQTNNKVRNTILSLAVALAATFSPGQLRAQDATHGNLSLEGGWGSATPWKADLRLQLPTQKIRITPFISLEGITTQGNNMKEDASYRYEHSQNLYESSSELRTSGIGVKYGTGLLAPINKDSRIDAMFEAQHRRQKTTGQWNERLISSDGDPLSLYHWNVDVPLDNLDQLRAAAGYNYKGLRLEYALLYSHSFLDYNREPLDGFGGGTRADSRTMDTKVYNHQARLSYLFRLGKGHQLTAGLAYLRNDIDREHVMNLTQSEKNTVFTPFFSHTYQTESVFAEYRFTHRKVKASARMEYGLTHMQYDTEASDPACNPGQKLSQKRKPMHDVIPQARVQWGASRHDTLTADYRMILKRPDADLLDPTHIYAAHTEDYGEVTLKGIHINNLSLTYYMHRKCVDYTTALGAIIVNDGFNALWMMDGFKPGEQLTNIRLTTWGNEGKRRAYSITQRLGVRPAKGTKLMAQATLLWDKRIAEAIHMQHEHWGINAQASVEQQLAARTTLDLHGLYSEGNTIDLYSYEGRSYGAGLALRHSFCKNLTGSIGYDYREYNRIVITQCAHVGGRAVGHTGYLYSRPLHPHFVKLNLTYRF